ncbi:unnamed protein product [Nesidiocoris tenuis]|uniref:Uncharacterized protein n=1 Tax=Nesidiocoris tenuis TaxID=355587 RepID=A0A6H5FT08_9HEMI|nr:unnamed protein product [Nesidiocoris tenuis]
MVVTRGFVQTINVFVKVVCLPQDSTESLMLNLDVFVQVSEGVYDMYHKSNSLPCLRFALRPKQFKEVIAAFNPKKDEPTVNSSVGNHFGSATVYVQPFLSNVSLGNDDFVVVNQITDCFDSVEFRPVSGWSEEDDRPERRNAL